MPLSFALCAKKLSIFRPARRLCAALKFGEKNSAPHRAAREEPPFSNAPDGKLCGNPRARLKQTTLGAFLPAVDL